MLPSTDMINKLTKCSFSWHRRDQTLFSGLWHDEPRSSSAYQLPWSFVQFYPLWFNARQLSSALDSVSKEFDCFGPVRVSKKRRGGLIQRWFGFWLSPHVHYKHFSPPVSKTLWEAARLQSCRGTWLCLRVNVLRFKAAEQKWLIKYILAVKSFPVVRRFAVSDELCIIRPQVPRKSNRNLNAAFVYFMFSPELKKKNSFGQIGVKACFR